MKVYTNKITSLNQLSVTLSSVLENQVNLFYQGRMPFLNTSDASLNSKIGPVNISFKTHIHQYLTDVLTRIKQPMNLLPKLSYYIPLKILNQFILYYSTHIRDRET